jgi:hypothetical protein
MGKHLTQVSVLALAALCDGAVVLRGPLVHVTCLCLCNHATQLLNGLT